MSQVVSDTAWVLHQRPYRDSSRIVECLTEHHGRVALVAKGVRGQKSQAKAAALQPFSLVWIEWSGRAELKTLRSVESRGGLLMLDGEALFAGFYMNELLLRLLKAGDDAETIYASYSQALLALAKAPESLLIELRHFEKRLLDALGYGLQTSQDVLEAQPVEPQAVYQFHLQYGPQRSGLSLDAGKMRVSGEALLALAAENLTVQQATEVTPLMRAALKQYLGDKPLRSRELLMAQRKLSIESNS